MRPPVLVVWGADVPEQLRLLGIQTTDGRGARERRCDLTRLRDVHDALGGADAVADEIVMLRGRSFLRSEMKARAQAIRRKARRARARPKSPSAASAI
jgi:hypothetical protein